MDALITQLFLILLDSGAIIDFDVGFGPKAYYYTWSYQRKELQRVPQSFYRRVKTKMCANPYA